MKGFTVVSLSLLTVSVALAQQSVVRTITVRGATNISEVAIKAAMQTKEGSAVQSAKSPH